MKVLLFVGLLTSTILISAGIEGGIYIMDKGGKAEFATTSSTGDEIKGTCLNYASIFRVDEGKMNIALPLNSFEFKEMGLIDHFKSEDYLNYKKSDAFVFNGSIEGFNKDVLEEGKKMEFTLSGEFVVAGEIQATTQKLFLTKSGDKVLGSITFDVDLANYGIELSEAINAKFGSEFTLTCELEWSTMVIKKK